MCRGAMIDLLDTLEHACDNPRCRFSFYDVSRLGELYYRLPYCKRILLECAVRKYLSFTSCTKGKGQASGPSSAAANPKDSSKIEEGEQVSELDSRETWRITVEGILGASFPNLDTSTKGDGGHNKIEKEQVLFHPGRVVLQEFTSLPALVDMTAMRDCSPMATSESNPDSSRGVIDSACPADLVIDNFVQVDFSIIKAAVAGAIPSRPSSLNFPSQWLGTVPAEEQLVFTPPSSSFPKPNLRHQVPHIVQPTFSPCESLRPPIGVPAGTVLPFHSLHPEASRETNGARSELHDSHLCGQKNLHIPNDNPGLPIQQEVCPFHQHISYWADLLTKSRKAEAEKNKEKLRFLKWVDISFANITVIPPSLDNWHQLNIEFLARVVTVQNGLLFPDTAVGTDSNSSSINGLGVLGWTVGTVEAEAVMFGHPLTMVAVPKVVGVCLYGTPSPFCTSTDLVLLITKRLRQRKTEGEEDGSLILVEFFGSGVKELSVPDRSAVSNLCVEYGANAGYFPVDEATMTYLRKTGRDNHQLSLIEAYLKRVAIFKEGDTPGIDYDEVFGIDLGDIKVTISGPSSAKERIALPEVSVIFRDMSVRGPRSYLPSLKMSIVVDIDHNFYTVTHGTILSASIASCTSTSNPSVMLAAGLLAKNAVEAGLSVPKFVRTSLAPGGGVVTSYLLESGVMPYLYMLGFEVVGYGCPTCVNNHGRKRNSSALSDIMAANNIMCCSVLAGNRNFDGRRNPLPGSFTFLASAPLVVAYALSGRIDIDFERDPLGKSSSGKPIFLSEVWPSRKEIMKVEREMVIPAAFNRLRIRLSSSQKWLELDEDPQGFQYDWDPRSTYLTPPRYINDLVNCEAKTAFKKLTCLAKFGDNVTSDHISPAGSIVRNSPAAEYLSSKGLAPRQFNSYGARRGNWQVMMAGTFSHPKLHNVMVPPGKKGPYTIHHPSRLLTTIVDASEKYRLECDDSFGNLFVIGGSNFGRGAPRDWAVKGPLSLGVRVFIAVSFDPAYRANLVKSGILPLTISKETWECLSGDEMISFDIEDPKDVPLKPQRMIQLRIHGADVKDSAETLLVEARVCLESWHEVHLYKKGGVVRDTFRRFNVAAPIND